MSLKALFDVVPLYLSSLISRSFLRMHPVLQLPIHLLFYKYVLLIFVSAPFLCLFPLSRFPCHHGLSGDLCKIKLTPLLLLLCLPSVNDTTIHKSPNPEINDSSANSPFYTPFAFKRFPCSVELNHLESVISAPLFFQVHFPCHSSNSYQVSHLDSGNSHLTGPLNSHSLLALPTSYKQRAVYFFTSKQSGRISYSAAGIKAVVLQRSQALSVATVTREPNTSLSYAFTIMDFALVTTGRLQIHTCCYHCDLITFLSS